MADRQNISDPVSSSNRELVERLTLSKIEERFITLLGVDLDSGVYHVIKDTPWHPGELSGEKAYDLALSARAFASTLDDKVREIFERYSDIVYLRRRFARDDMASFTFKAEYYGKEDWVTVMELVISRHTDGTPSIIAVAFSLADSNSRENYELQKRLKENIEIIGGLAKEFDILHIITLDEDVFWPYVQNKGFADEVLNMSAPGMSWSQALTISNKPMVHPDYLDAILKYADKDYIKGLLRDKIRHSLRIRMRKEMGSPVFHWWDFVVIKLDDADKPATRIAMGYINVDEQVMKEQAQQKQLEDALSMAQSSSRAKTTFLNNMSHDIRTPMNAIIGYTGLAMTHIDDKKQLRDYLEKISQSSDHLLSLINEVLDMSRIESGKVKIDEKDENLAAIVRSLCGMLQASIDSKQISFALDMDGVRNENVVCDRLRLEQILINVLTNAIKYTPAGGKVLFKISESGEDNGTGYATYRFYVKDTGIGMNRDFLDTIFEPFSRAQSSTVSGIQGTGLGMAITKNLVDMMGGDIGIDSEEGVGTEVKLGFDFRIASAVSKTEQHSGTGTEHSSAVSIDLKGSRILVVEDNALNMEIATAVLKEFGCEVFPAGDGRIAVEMVKNASPDDYDLILMDIQMPVIDGYEATRQIRALQTEISRIPIIAMTANAFEEDRKAAFEAGMDEHIAKPIDIDELKETLSRFKGLKLSHR